jgi:hypothetical protein
MVLFRLAVLTAASALVLSGCGQPSTYNQPARNSVVDNTGFTNDFDPGEGSDSTIWDLFRTNDDPNRTINVNRYLWSASLDVLSFLPIETIDPFSGVISTDWGRVQGSSTPYRATVYVDSAALDALSLKVAVFRLSGGRSVPVSDEVAKDIENSILTRARQIYIAEQQRRG